MNETTETTETVEKINHYLLEGRTSSVEIAVYVETFVHGAWEPKVIQTSPRGKFDFYTQMARDYPTRYRNVFPLQRNVSAWKVAEQ